MCYFPESMEYPTSISASNAGNYFGDKKDVFLALFPNGIELVSDNIVTAMRAGLDFDRWACDRFTDEDYEGFLTQKSNPLYLGLRQAHDMRVDAIIAHSRVLRDQNSNAVLNVSDLCDFVRRRAIGEASEAHVKLQNEEAKAFENRMASISSQRILPGKRFVIKKIKRGHEARMAELNDQWWKQYLEFPHWSTSFASIEALRDAVDRSITQLEKLTLQQEEERYHREIFLPREQEIEICANMIPKIIGEHNRLVAKRQGYRRVA